MTKTALADDDDSLSPTEELVMEVLAGRYRLGETWWPFTNNSTASRAANALESRGLVSRMGGQVENTFRLILTGKGITERGLDKPYTAPKNKDKGTMQEGYTVLVGGGGSGKAVPSWGSGGGKGGSGGGGGIAYVTTKTRADDWKSGFDAGWIAREGQPR